MTRSPFSPLHGSRQFLNMSSSGAWLPKGHPIPLPLRCPRGCGDPSPSTRGEPAPVKTEAEIHHSHPPLSSHSVHVILSVAKRSRRISPSTANPSPKTRRGASNMNDYLTQLSEFASQVSYNRLSDSARTAAADVIMDTIGAIIGGSRSARKRQPRPPRRRQLRRRNRHPPRP